MGRQSIVRQAGSLEQHSAQPSRIQPKALSDQRLKEQRRTTQSKLTSSSKDGLNWLLLTGRLFQRHVWLFWIVTASIVIGSATAAITTILDPDASIPHGSISVASPLFKAEPVKPPLKELPTPVLPASPNSAVDSDNADSDNADFDNSPQLLQKPAKRPSTASLQSAVGAIVLSCAAGCFLLSQWLKPKPARRKVLFESQSSSQRNQRLNRLNQQVQAANTTVTLAAPLVLPEVPELPNLPQLPAAPSISFDLKPAEPQATETLPPEMAEVTILPIEQSHPLDWDEPSLADSLDLRQRRPLSYWL
jgi:hypothetical protein